MHGGGGNNLPLPPLATPLRIIDYKSSVYNQWSYLRQMQKSVLYILYTINAVFVDLFSIQVHVIFWLDFEIHNYRHTRFNNILY